MAESKLGIKRVCPKCEAKFYDLKRNPAICPKCGYEYDALVVLRPQRSRKAELSKPEVEPSSPKNSVGSEPEVNEAGDIEGIEDIYDVEIDVADDGDEDSVFEDSEDLNVSDDVIGVIDQSSETKEV